MAEVLKSMGRLDDAFELYQQISIEHPQNVVARNGMAGILIALKKWKEALGLTTRHQQPRTKNEWITLHIHGMILLQMGKVREAQEIFEQGVEDCGHIDCQSFFINTLLLVHLKLKAAERARELIESHNHDSLNVPDNVVRLNVYGFLGERTKAQRAYDRVADNHLPLVVSLRDELKRRYLDNRPARYSDEWVLEHQIECLLQVA